MRKLLVFFATGLVALGTAGVASPAVLNWEGTSTTLLGDYPPGVLTGGGVATVNGSAGAIPAHLSTRRLAASRGQIGGTFTKLVTDPDTIANGVAALIFSKVRGGTGTQFSLSGGAASTSAGGGTSPVYGVIKICLLSTACTQYLPLVLNQPTTVNGVPGTGEKGIGLGGLLTAGGYGGIRISVLAAPWTIKTATALDQITPTGGPPRVFITKIAKGWAHAPASTTTSTAQPGGMFQLVTPSQTLTNLASRLQRQAGGSRSWCTASSRSRACCCCSARACSAWPSWAAGACGDRPGPLGQQRTPGGLPRKGEAAFAFTTPCQVGLAACPSPRLSSFVICPGPPRSGSECSGASPSWRGWFGSIRTPSSSRSSRSQPTEGRPWARAAPSAGTAAPTPPAGPPKSAPRTSC